MSNLDRTLKTNGLKCCSFTKCGCHRELTLENLIYTGNSALMRGLKSWVSQNLQDKSPQAPGESDNTLSLARNCSCCSPYKEDSPICISQLRQSFSCKHLLSSDENWHTKQCGSGIPSLKVNFPADSKTNMIKGGFFRTRSGQFKWFFNLSNLCNYKCTSLKHLNKHIYFKHTCWIFHHDRHLQCSVFLPWWPHGLPLPSFLETWENKIS